MLALVMSAVSPDLIGIVVWKEHPTLRALTKMVTSARYRFPTVDSDERMRDEMKKCEQAARDEVSPFSYTFSTGDGLLFGTSLPFSLP
jgi:hypothetical protein